VYDDAAGGYRGFPAGKASTLTASLGLFLAKSAITFGTKESRVQNSPAMAHRQVLIQSDRNPL
jgi:hypothetical protein